jgi:hypothetical protein
METRNGGGSWPAPGHGGSGSTPPQSTTINVTITPTGPEGSHVSGHLYVDAFDGFTANSDELIDLPYAYTVG